MSRWLLLSLFLSLTTFAPAQQYWQKVSGTLGGFVPVGRASTAGFNSAPVFAFDYGLRFHKYGQFDAGVDTVFGESFGRQRNLYIPRLGYSVLIPIWAERIELTAGAGAGHAFYKPTIQDYEAWLVYGQFGADYALVPDGRYRAGMMVRWYREPIGAPSQQWVSVGATVSYHFGR